MTTAIAPSSERRFHVEQARPAPEPLFDSAHQALLFAYTYGPNAHAEAAAVERRIMDQARERYERMRYVSRGLSGVDGAAQAGMIKRRVEAMRPLQHRRMIEATFAILDPRVRTVAMRDLAILSRRRHGWSLQEIRMVGDLVQRRFGAKVTLPELEERHEVPHRTMVRRWVDVRRYLDELDREALARMESWMVEKGIVVS